MPFEITPLLAGLIGVISAMLLVTGTILAALKVRSERRAQRPGDLPLKKATAPSSEDLYDADDRNPDVVPTNKGMYICTSMSLLMCVFMYICKYLYFALPNDIRRSIDNSYISSHNVPTRSTCSDFRLAHHLFDTSYA